MLNALILLLLAAGQFELMVTLVNRLHAYRIRGPALRWVRDIHELLILLLPVFMAWVVGWHGTRLLAGGAWSELPIGWLVYLGICGLGTLGMLCSAGRFALRKLPALQLSNHTHVVDVAKELGYRPLGKGPYSSLARLPRNQLFEVEVSEKVYRLPRLPAEWDGLSILHLTDFHYTGTLDRPFYEHLIHLAQETRPDLAVFTGDLLDDMKLLDWLPPTLGRITAPLGRYFILGNHDWYLEPEPIRQAMIDIGWHDVAGKTALIGQDKPTLVIGGSELPWMGMHPDYSAAPPDAFRILLSHTPDNLPWARRQRVDLMLSGHNHGGQVVLPVVGPIYSPSKYGCRFASGVFQTAPTLLYVSRGISGRHPLRWRCRPELTKLVLRAD